MQTKKLEEIRKKWGDKPCTHPSIGKIYDLGAHDGYGCSQCGTWHYNKEDFKKDRENNKLFNPLDFTKTDYK